MTALYDINEFKDNCGFGLIADKSGNASNDIIAKAIQALTNMTHRGGIAADGKTGDGCGLLIKKPDTFFRSVLADEGIELTERYLVGFLFLDADTNTAKIQRNAADKAFQNHGLTETHWRLVPTDDTYIGPMANATLPSFWQVFVPLFDDQDQVDALTFKLRRRIEQLKQATPALPGELYVASLSEHVVIYKGLMMPEDLAHFYPDLANNSLTTSICVFHQRFSTNTSPQWRLAQPFRMLAHNGEINTIMGNRNWADSRTPKFVTEQLPDIDTLAPLVNRDGSDSSSLDNMLQLLTAGGVEIHRAIRMLIPPAWQNIEDMDPDIRAFYEFNSMHMEAWDGPAGLVLTDGRYAVCALDRNGLRPSRWVITDNNWVTVASETGVWDYPASSVVAKGQLGPGQMLSVDIEQGLVRFSSDIDALLKASKPYKQWLKSHARRLEDRLHDEGRAGLIDADHLVAMQKLHGVTYEEREQLIRTLAETGQEAVGSMGDDTPMAVLSRQNRSLYDYFRQMFAQVTNPPIDPLRESIVMSLETCLGREKNIFDETPDHADRLVISSPILSPAKYQALKATDIPAYRRKEIHHLYDPNEMSLKDAIKQFCEKAEQAVRDGCVVLVLSDKGAAKNWLPISSLLMTGAVHHHLIDCGLRCESNIVVKTASARDAHQMATLIGYGATAIYPYLAYQVIDQMVDEELVLAEHSTAYANYRKGLEKGLLKIMSKMGISTINSYRGSQLFEIIGLNKAVVDLCFKGTPSRIAGAGFAELEEKILERAQRAWIKRKPLSQGGLTKFVHGQEYHAFNPDIINTLHRAVKTGDERIYREYADLVNNRPMATLRDLLGLKEVEPIDIKQVEPVEAIFKRFDSAAMSLGALSPEAHEALAQAMNDLGGRSNSGEGGEDSSRFNSNRVSKIKQIASGRFGVTPHYLANAEVLQIKIAQGAKPGEGGQLPGGKVNKLIAKLRYCVPGVTLISPPPHHDIYSIEDLAQLIFDLKQVNPTAKVSVKLVSEPGVGTIAAGVAKAYADFITVSGYDGGTAASPITSIRYAGSPWELGLAEAHQTLQANDLRDKVRVQTDGGLKTGLDIIKATLLGAESYAFGTTPMVALGCKYLRICHLNNCATGVATQNDELREDYYIGTVEMAKNFFRFIAQDTRQWMAKLGARSLDELVGRTDLLELLDGETQQQQHLDLAPLIHRDALLDSKPNVCGVAANDPHDKGTLAQYLVDQLMPAIEQRQSMAISSEIDSKARSIGARISGEIAKRWGNQGMETSPISLKLTGVAGQSLGVWNAGGLHIYLEGDANDYVGKGMAGGKIVIRPPSGSVFCSNETAIMGNTCLYGATGGRLFAAGMAGERLGVRNSGAVAVVEGAGDHCCEYMTGGCITVLGDTGYNFGAGMTGGLAYVLDLENKFVDRCNHELVELTRLVKSPFEAQRRHLKSIIEDHVEQTGSAWGKTILDNFADYVGRFWLVKPKASSINSLMNNLRARPE